MYSVRTGLAVEAVKIASEKGAVDGIVSTEEQKEGITISRVEVLNEQGEQACGKKKGHYITLDLENMSSGSGEEFLKKIDVVAEEIKSLAKLAEGDNVLIAGLGNTKVTPDALGPKTVDNIMVTRHLKEHLPDFFNEAKLRDVAAIAPGVLGQTGVETAEIIKGVTAKINPKVVIVIDALASRRLKRLATTIQISDTGITPGGGVGNERAEISQNTLGVPVISIGVPTVVDAATLASDVIDETIKMAEQQNRSDLNMPPAFKDENKSNIMRDALTPYDLNLVITPKDIDSIITAAAKTVGYSINRALQGNITVEDMTQFLE